MVSGEVLTGAPVEVGPRPVLASALLARLRAVSLAICAVVVAALAVVVAALALFAVGALAKTVPASALVDLVPPTAPPLVLT